MICTFQWRGICSSAEDWILADFLELMVCNASFSCSEILFIHRKSLWRMYHFIISSDFDSYTAGSFPAPVAVGISGRKPVTPSFHIVVQHKHLQCHVTYFRFSSHKSCMCYGWRCSNTETSSAYLSGGLWINSQTKLNAELQCNIPTVGRLCHTN